MYSPIWTMLIQRAAGRKHTIRMIAGSFVATKKYLNSNNLDV